MNVTNKPINPTPPISNVSSEKGAPKTASTSRATESAPTQVTATKNPTVADAMLALTGSMKSIFSGDKGKELPPEPANQGAASNFLERSGDSKFIKAKPGNGIEIQKQKVVDALDKAGANDLEKYTIVAMLQNESPDGKKLTHPEGHSSAFNIPDGLLARLGHKGKEDQLDKPGNIGDAAKILLESMRSDKMENGYYKGDSFSNTLLFFRGGEPGYKDGKSFNAQKYIDVVANLVHNMRKDGPESLTNSTRYASETIDGGSAKKK